MLPTFFATRLRIQGVFNHTRNDTPDSAAMRARHARPRCYLSTIKLDQIFYVLFCVCIFFYCEQVAPHYYGAIPEFVLLYFEEKLGT
jgi:hypothetical protein